MVLSLRKTIKTGFCQSKSSSCLFISNNVIVLIYVVDTLYFHKDKLTITTLTDKMIKEGILFQEEGSVADYLGVCIDWGKNGSMNLTQKGLID